MIIITLLLFHIHSYVPRLALPDDVCMRMRARAM